MKTLRFGKLVVLVALTLCVVSGSFVVNAYADMWGDIADGLKNGGRTVVGDGYFKVQIHNNTNQTIWVAAIYGTEDRGITIFRKKGWWELSAGETAYIVDTKYRTIYFYAHNSSGAEWAGNHSSMVLKTSFYAPAANGDSFASKGGYTAKFFEVDMGGRFTTFTQNFSN